ncbi:MAG: hypothetical protein E7E23_02250 [Paenibacillus sp.]|uniref:hypothetical protein n=1 Tax=Paenibacillus sp. TaxID=58172 RepID=UPI002903568A|nr:hypothetical protein [Paenibacillus sp.]MDU2239372.1 hypothetical protein [Paenibacillus sp.]
MSKVTVIDAIMGAGKTNFAIQYMTEAPADKRFIYITPFLTEVDRIIENVKGRNFMQPTNANSEGRKLRSLKELIIDGQDIAATHSLFKTADDELIHLLKGAGYTLILDEVMDVIEPVNIKTGDIRILLDGNKIEIIDNKVVWKEPGYDADRFNDIKLYAEAENLFIYRDTYILWAFPKRVFECFDDVFIMTYLFEAQNMSYYFKLHNIQYDTVSVRDGMITDHDVKQERREDLIKLIDVHEGKMNETGNKHAYSASWLRRGKRDAERLETVKKNLRNYLRNVLNAPINAIMWSTLKEVEQTLKGRGYATASIPVNARATNEYADKWALAYVFNRFKNPYETSFFEDNGIKVDEDKLAVSDLLQWIWRSRIRKGEPVSLYLPSSRMRSLLQAWANYEI